MWRRSSVLHKRGMEERTNGGPCKAYRRKHREGPTSSLPSLIRYMSVGCTCSAAVCHSRENLQVAEKLDFVTVFQQCFGFQQFDNDNSAVTMTVSAKPGAFSTCFV